MPLTFKLRSGERWRGVQIYVGRLCRVHYRGGTYGDFDRSVVGIVRGASYHLTNGNSTGDLIVGASTPEQRFELGDGRYPCVSIALAHVGEIEVLEERAWTGRPKHIGGEARRGNRDRS